MKVAKPKGVAKARPSVDQTRVRMLVLMDGVVIRTRADLARHLGVSRAYVTLVLGPVVHAVHAERADARDARTGASSRGDA